MILFSLFAAINPKHSSRSFHSNRSIHSSCSPTTPSDSTELVEVLRRGLIDGIGKLCA
jgi:hypothetical protein